MKKLRNNKIRKLLAFMVALALMVSCMPSAYTISASEAFGDGTEDIFTDGEFTSEPAAEESTPDVSSADQEKTEQAQQSTLTYENDSVKVTAEALEDGALPQNTALKADSVNENSSVSYDTVSQKLSAAATDKGSSLRGFFAYDVYFADGDGNRVEPNGRVRVTFEYKTPAAPELTDAASTSVTVEKLHYNSSTGDTDVNTLQANEDLKVLNVNEGKQIQTLQVETGNAAVFAVMWDSPETADVEAEAVSGNEDEVPIASEELTDGVDISDEPEQDAAETPAAENPEVTPDAEPSEAPAENPDAEPTEAPAEDPDVVEEPTEDIESPEDAPAADENGETSLIEVLGDDTNLRVSPSVEAEVLATVNAGTQLTLLDTVTAEDGATWYKVSWEGTEAYIRSDMAQVVDSSDEAEEPEDVQEEEIQPEITRYDYKSDEVNVKVTLTDPADLPDNAELSVTPVELSQEAEDQITEEAIKEKKAIEKIHSYDIKFLVDGEEVQPGASVKVSVSLNDEKKIKDADVYHVDENDNVENMDGSVAKNGDVEFETTHFSTYVIVNNSLSGKVEVRLQHYCGDTKIYADTVRHIEVGGKIPDYRATENYNIDKVVVVKDNGEETPVHDIHEVQVASDTVVKIYYIPKPSTEESGDVVFYDYQVKPKKNNNKGINDLSHYQKRDKSNMMIMGTQKQTGLGDYNAYGDNGKNANIYVENDNRVTTGLVTGLSNDYKEVVWKVDQPGFFTDDNLGEDEGKEKYTSYKLLFSKTGNNYKLTGVKQPGGGYFKCNDNGSYFYPLKDPIDDGTERGQDYFGMRYDIEFKLGDYVGPLNYKFTGDDDLWVLLDGKKVVIDVGGIHKSIESSADLWKDLGFKEGIGASTDEEKNKTHRITVLYMERGAYESNCKMDFTIPDARFVNVENVPLADITLHKVDSKGKGVSGAKFKLVNDKGGETYPVTTSDADGNVTFNNLKEGTYTLTEAVAPDGYVASKEAYKVEVTVSGDKATAKLYKADERTEVANNQIVNYTEKEEAIKNLTSSKEVKVDNYEERTYQVDLNAEVTGRESGVEAKGASVVMVLDASGSMKGDKIKTLKTAAKGFIKKLHDESPISQVSVIWYSGTEGYDTNLTTENSFVTIDDKGKTTLDGYIDNPGRNIDGGPPMGAALKAAYEKLGSAKYSNKYVLLMTDGRPGYASNKGYDDTYGWRYDNWNCMVANNAVNYASKIKENAVMYTVGVGEDLNKSFYWNAKHSSDSDWYDAHPLGHGKDDYIKGTAFLEKLATQPKSADQKYAYNTDDLDKLTGIFTAIAGKIGDLFSVQPQKIVDTIDPRFELTKNGLNQLANNCHLGEGTIETKDGSTEIIWKDSKTKEELGKVTIIKNSNGSTTITWTGGAAKIGNKEATETKDQGWKANFQIKAKDDFIGGNMVPTNGADSGIYLDNESTRFFDQPSVNVRLLSLSIGNDETTVFKGESIDPSGYANELAKTLKVVELDGKTTTITGMNPVTGEGDSKTPTFPTLMGDQKKELTEKGTITLDTNKDGSHQYEYTYPGTNEPVGYFTYTYKLSDNPGGNMGVHEASTVGKAVEKYELEVTYYPYSKDTRKGMDALNNVKEPAISDGGTEVADKDIEAVNGTYTVNVIAGQIKITKKLPDGEIAQKDAEFTFEIYKVTTGENGEKVETKLKTEPTPIKATINKGQNVAKFSNNESITIANLAKGEYVVREVSNSGYTLETAVYDNTEATNCKAVNNETTKDVTFTIGTDRKGKNALEAKELKAQNVDYASYAGPGCVGKADFTNKEIVSDVNFVKIDAVKDLQSNTITISGAEFKLCKADADWKQGDVVKDNVESGANGAFGFEKLVPGNYLLIETKAATGYSLPQNPWKITVATDGTVTVTKNNGTVITPITSGDKNVYQIENAKVYSLPQSGGPGTYGFTISGVAILATALLLFINNKRREEEAKRS
ncbi:SpaA isopeptide-forming pilin-related protein [Blautia massiliensis (ex Durand et al. 2017)]|uniref:SpaA isopeptide-forming pilin-related protein n=1 Tax=Blautia massiliensis (ex Durand et al. 2017) TaxID=1737424 RepID=UPI0022E58190|nr:SpaA isopeptide-forming pilin-related protein [Blautia massiliensis (ex Durand et al. 2017)]